MVAKRIRFDPSGALQAFRSVIPMQTIVEINATIERSSGTVPQDALPTVAADVLRQGDAFRQLEQDVCTQARAAAGPAEGALHPEPFHVIRCVGTAERAESHCRHYDSHLLTLLVPLQLAPDGDWNGDLLMYRRPRLAVSTLDNVMCKVRHGIHRHLPFSWRKSLTVRDLRRGNCSRVPVRLGSVYVFNGFAFKHANLDVQAGQRRSLLIHYYDPGHSLGLSALLRRIR